MNQEMKKELMLTPHHNVIDSIPILSVSDDTSIFEVRKGLFSKTYALQDVNFSIAKLIERGEMFISYEGFLNALDPSQSMQIMVLNHKIVGSSDADDAVLPEVGDDLDELRREYNKIVLKNVEEGHSNIKKEKFITLSQECNDMVAAEKAFSMAENELLTHIQDIPGADVRGLSLVERINLLRGIYNPGTDSDYQEYSYIKSKKVKSFSIKNMYRQGVSARELVQPASMEFRDDYFKLGHNVYGRALDLERLPKSIKDSFLSDMTNVDFDIILTMNIKQIEKGEAYRLVDRKLTNIEADFVAVRTSTGIASHRLRADEEEVNSLMDDISKRDQNLYDVKMHIVIFAETLERLNEFTSKVKTMARAKGVYFKNATGMQEQSFNSTLPYGSDSTGIYRTLTTESVAGFMPFSVQELQTKRTKRSIPISYGVNKVSRSIITYDRFSGDAYNAFTFGFTGSGKSVTAKQNILSTYLADDDCDIFILDPNAEYFPLVNALQGQVVDVIGSGKQRLNPLDINKDYGAEGQDAVASKIDTLISMCQVMLGSNLLLSGIQKNAIIMAGKKIYEPWLRNDKKDEFIPTLDDFYEVLMQREDVEKSADIYELAQTVERFTSHGVDVIFSGKTNVNIENRLVALNIQDLGDDLKPLAMLIILDMIWNRLCRNRALKKRTYLFIDEIHLLFKSEMVAAYLQKIWKIIRKYNGAPMGITQNVEDVVNTEAGRAIINNTPFIIMLKQSEMDRRALTALFNLSDTQLGYITNSRPGEGLLYVQASQNLATTSIIPFMNKIPEDSPIFKLITTKIVKDDEE